MTILAFFLTLLALIEYLITRDKNILMVLAVGLLLTFASL